MRSRRYLHAMPDGVQEQSAVACEGRRNIVTTKIPSPGIPPSALDGHDEV